MSTQQLPREAVDTGYRDLDLRVLDCVKIQAWDHVLFVQCGDGWIVEEAWRRAQRAYACGLDTSPAQVDLARRLREVPGKLEFRTWDGYHLPVQDNAFGRVVVNLTGTEAPAVAVLNEVRRALQPSGRAYLLLPATYAGDLKNALAAWPAAHEVARWHSPEVVLVGTQKMV